MEPNYRLQLILSPEGAVATGSLIATVTSPVPIAVPGMGELVLCEGAAYTVCRRLFHYDSTHDVCTHVFVTSGWKGVGEVLLDLKQAARNVSGQTYELSPRAIGFR